MAHLCNRRPKCNHEKYKDHDKCILHCDKSDFDDNDISLFWNRIRLNYHIDEEIIVEGISFPKFDLYQSYKASNFHNDNDIYWKSNFNYDLTFIKCTFIDDFDLNYTSSTDILTFDNCVFYGDIKFKSINNLELIKCEFKNEFLLENTNCDNLDIQNTKFIKDVNIQVNEKLNICENSIFRNNLEINGKSTLKTSIENSSCDKQLTIENNNFINIKDVKLKNDIYFKAKNNDINLENIIFLKEVIFESFNNLAFHSLIFKDELIFNGVDYGQIDIINTKMNNLELANVNKLNIIDKSEILGYLKLKEKCEDLLIEDSQINGQLEFNGASNIELKHSKIMKDAILDREYDNIKINQCVFNNVSISATNTLNIENSDFNKNIDLIGKAYQNISISNCQIEDTLQINKVDSLKLNNVISNNRMINPSLKLIYESYNEIEINNSYFNDFKIAAVNSLITNDVVITGDILFSGDNYDVLSFNNVKIENEFKFPTTEKLSIKDSQFYNRVDFNSINSMTVNKVEFKSEVIFDELSGSLEFVKCQFDKFILFNRTEKLVINRCIFNGELDFDEERYGDIVFSNTILKNKVDFRTTIIEKLEFYSDTIESTDYETIFHKNIDFSYSELNDLKIDGCIFHGDIILNQLEKKLNLSNISNVKSTGNILLNNVTILNLFSAGTNIDLSSLSISNSILTLDDKNIMGMMKSESILLKDINIDNFKLKEIVLTNDLNFQNMTIKELNILSSNLEKTFRIKNSFIEHIDSKDNIFEDLQIIDNKYTTNKDIKRIINYENTTIKNAVFDKLVFDEFLMSDAHVSDAKIGYVKFNKGSRETNRFFKNYYDSISDYITANKYYAKEMDEHLKTSESIGEKIILFFGKSVSGFGQSWILPFIWMIFFTLVFYRIANFELLSMDGFRENHISWMLNDILKFINPFTKKTTVDYGLFYWAWFSHKIFMTIFGYHFIIAIKRKTKR